jgi:uncharacterized protein (TIGR00369 family)
MTNSRLTESERERIERIFRDVPFAHMLGIELVELDRGDATVQLFVRDQLLQNHGVVHGGVIASLVDTAAAFAILTLLEPGQATTTVDLTIHYLRPLLQGQATARARVVRAGRRIITVSADVLLESKVLAATALTTYIRLT